ncbi:MAG: NAD(+)/NADH kinase [Clostridia bacterium]|nr:NAD(+)/NADH kinase [Clostridia bacterium]
MKIAIIPNENKQDYIENTSLVCARLLSLGHHIVLPQKLRMGISFDESEYADTRDIFRECDMIIAVGGDGTIMHKAKAAAQFGKPVLGINAGRLGYLAGLEMSELDELKYLCTDHFKTEKRMMLRVALENGKSFHAVNDCVVYRGASGRMADFVITAEGHRVIKCRADGIIAATPTGSTGYSLSAGGPIIDPSTECIMITPICAHSLSSRPVLFGADTRLIITIPESSSENGVLTIDGETIAPVERMSGVSIERSDKFAYIMRKSNISFYKTLQSKLNI